MLHEYTKKWFINKKKDIIMYSSDFLDKNWQQLASQYSTNTDVISKIITEIKDQYNSQSRSYHNLHHIEHFLQLAMPYSEKLQQKDAFFFAVWFHDVIYRPFRKNNEAKSAELAAERLIQLGVANADIDQVVRLINETASHRSKYTDFDTLLFMDCDLQILGSKPKEYFTYIKQIRKEYQTVPSLMYYSKRKEFLKKMLDFPSIFKTHDFKIKYEQQARLNIQNEIDSIS